MNRTKTKTASQDELCVNGTSIHRFEFVADAMVKIIAVNEFTPQQALAVADRCFDALCARFPDDSEVAP
jgi:hypothetical protein